MHTHLTKNSYLFSCFRLLKVIFGKEFINLNTLILTINNNNNTSTTMTSLSNITTNNSKTNNNETCIPIFDNINLIENNIRCALLIAFMIGGCVDILVNSLVIYLIKITKQWRNQSTFLILMVSILDVGTSLVNNTWMSMYILLNDQIKCSTKNILNGVSHLFVLATSYMFTIIALDRYFHILFLNDYATKFTPKRFKITLMLWACISGLQVFLGWFVPYHGVSRKAVSVLPLNFLIFLTTVILFLVSIKRLKSFQSESISTNTKKLVTMTSIYLMFYFAFYIPIIIYQVFIRILVKDLGVRSVITFAIYLITNANGVTNGIGFIMKNRESRSVLTSMLNKFFNKNRNQVTVQN